MAHKLQDTETILQDDYPVFPGYAYIADGVFITSPIGGTVGGLKVRLNAKEIRRCDLFDHPGARLGDKVE